jgi:hypothetical protein
LSEITEAVSAAIRKVVSFLADLAPGPPSDEPAPPDIDGKRPSEADLTAIKVDLERKDGKGGYR